MAALHKVSGDGRYIFGVVDGTMARWPLTAQGPGPVEYIPVPAGYTPTIGAASFDGSALCGTMRLGTTSTTLPWYWREGLGVVQLRTYLPDFGMSLSPWSNISLGDMSDDGYTILGVGRASTSDQSFLIELPRCGTADYDCDGDVGTDADIETFFACLGGNCAGTCFPGGSDFNRDGDAGTDADIESFFRVLAGGAC
ncbi:MAG: hypothetical protein H7210_09255 [Pyrinomonadaceae bacterium]|nr:hypothetical protein [Phycisphaerales bacterium]